MKFPYIVLESLNDEQINKWNNCYETFESKYDYRNRKIDEGIWRRTQMFFTRNESGWKTRDDMRRRMIHYLHTYDVQKNNGKTNLVMSQSYVWIHLSFPSDEINDYLNDILLGINEGNWNKEKESKNYWLYYKDDLYYEVKLKEFEEKDIEKNNIFPDNYRFLEVKIYTNGIEDNSDAVAKTWNVYHFGPRIRDRTGNYETINNIEEIKRFLPAHVELGCGPSIEVGIPPLNFLHDVYYVTDKETSRFILGSHKDKLAYMIASKTFEMYKLFSKMYITCFLASPTSTFYMNLKKLYEMGYILDPIFTNNFDGLPIQLGLDEYYMRRYERSNLVPKVHFDPSAKSLISIGCHADRRKIQQAARQKGLKVIHIDPEGYYKNGTFAKYPLEAIMENDAIYRKTSSAAFKKLLDCLQNDRN